MVLNTSIKVRTPAAIAALGKGAVDVWHLGDGTSRIVGMPGMAALPKALAKGLDVTLNTRVTTVRACGGFCEINTDAGKTTASHVVVTVPAPQLATILGETHAIVKQASHAVMRPCLTLMAAFNRDTPAPFMTRRDANSLLTWIAQNNTKPGRSTAYQTWVAQANRTGAPQILMLTGQRQKREWWSYFVQDWALILPNFATWACKAGATDWWRHPSVSHF
jgi:predicted NAD/FAD-dependent oxidoreductase